MNFETKGLDFVKDKKLKEEMKEVYDKYRLHKDFCNMIFIQLNI